MSEHSSQWSQADARASATGDDRSTGPEDETSFDHVSLALRHTTDLWPVLAGVLGGRFVGRGFGVGYGWTQLKFANGFRIEAIHPEPDTAPNGTGANFVENFLDKVGVGAHHLTFRVSDSAATAMQLREAGYSVLEQDHTGIVDWSEGIVSSLEAHGIILQVLTGEAQPDMELPEGFPVQDFDSPVASLGRVVHAVRDLDGALRLFRDILGGRVVSTGSAVDGNHWVELGWSGPGRLRLLEAKHAAIAEWVGDRPGRLRHLFFNFDEPQYVPGAEKVASGRWVVQPDDVLGTRFVLSSSAR